MKESEGDEQALYVLLGATGLRVSEALALESKHFVNDGRTIEIQQQVDRETPRIVSYLKTDAASGYEPVAKSIQVVVLVAHTGFGFVVGLLQSCSRNVRCR